MNISSIASKAIMLQDTLATADQNRAEAAKRDQAAAGTEAAQAQQAVDESEQSSDSTTGRYLDAKA